MAPGARVGHLDRVEGPICLDGARLRGGSGRGADGDRRPRRGARARPRGPQREESAILGSFIAALDGQEVGGRELATASFEEQDEGPPVASLDVQARLSKLPLLSQLMHTVASPPVAYLLLTIGLALLVFELFTAGSASPASSVRGSLVLAAYGLTVLPTNLVGLGLLLLGTFGFAVDVQTGAPVCGRGSAWSPYAVGSLLLFDDPVSLGWLPLVAGVVAMVLMMLAGLAGHDQEPLLHADHRAVVDGGGARARRRRRDARRRGPGARGALAGVRQPLDPHQRRRGGAGRRHRRHPPGGRAGGRRREGSPGASRQRVTL
jgi:membrane-bound serine protease (ClpP class)